MKKLCLSFMTPFLIRFRQINSRLPISFLLFNYYVKKVFILLYQMYVKIVGFFKLVESICLCKIALYKAIFIYFVTIIINITIMIIYMGWNQDLDGRVRTFHLVSESSYNMPSLYCFPTYVSLVSLNSKFLGILLVIIP